ncbi:hypothetical protein SAM23877_6179 [Streptomyces ambofaciens ATCC 23877]|uniref:Uncharacterized protein n=1 Tax=Streptomyces ambofaciens (strain ATCC 23877 / 3486 / DSM 40053 / JCM 4204 / NBRC 12836 / NRRL B-2516) TaxID=278992 RepID=A0A0K2B1R5_STRA7|nr:hypothetical protein SAM23877_6179 [Streptomyces ambofaciens ATCC 23877]WNA15419.1 hypothetical protein SAMYPH_88 [Streptomyces phage Samy]
MQCKDIPDATFLDAVRTAPASSAIGWRNRWDVHEALEAVMGHEIPSNLLMAKARRLESRGLLGGCTCGCRGDWHPSDECGDRTYCCPPRTMAA